MNYRQLGSSPLQVSEIGFGCMSLGENQVENERLIKKAIDLGINFFDTADLYQKGNNEISLGKAVHAERNQLVVATKVGNQWKPDGNGWQWNPGKEYILDAVNRSLERLQTDYIDLYQLHGGTIEDPIDDIIETFEKLKQQGKIRFYGISSIRPNVIREYVKRSGIVSVMMQYSLLDRRPEEESLSLLLDNKIGVLARGSLCKGLLVNKPATSYLNYNEDQVSQAVKYVQNLSAESRTAAQTALRFVLHHPAISSAVVGISSISQLEDAAATSTTPFLTENELRTLRQTVAVNYYNEHRG